MSIFVSLVKKEAIHIVRDPRTMIITLFMPLVLLLLFGFAISTEVNNVRIMSVVDNHDENTRQILERLSVNNYFSYQGTIAPQEVDNVLRAGKTDAVLFLKHNGMAIIPQVVVDASNTTLAQTIAGYMSGVLNYGNSYRAPVLTYTLYNPQMKSAYNFVPGIMGMIFILICAIMTSVSIVREKESGTMNLLLVSPAKSSAIILGKLVPYFLLSCLILATMLSIAYTVLGLPVSSAIFNVIWVSLIYIILSLSIGLFVSTLVETQLAALIVSAVLFMLPVITLSGMIFPIDNMPEVLKGVSCIIPARWYTSALRKLMIQHLDVSYIMQEVSIIVGMTILFLSLAILKFNSSNR
ncbi:MAG: ABC transporter permease [Muribaculaceae bacterium]|nr:ABC transporter permease [Muribaculaceae bacterium]